MACVTRSLVKLSRLVLLLAFAGVFFLYSSEVHAGTPDEDYKPERYFTTNIDQQQTTSTNYQDALTLTFTPPTTKNFLVVAQALTNNSLTSYSTVVQLLVDSASYTETYHKPFDASQNWRCFSTHKIISATGGNSYTIKIQFKTENATATAYVKRCFITVLEVSNYYTSESNDESSTTQSIYQDKTTLTFTPPTQADYIFLAVADTYNIISGKSAYAQFTIDGTSDVELETVNSPYSCWAHISKENLTAQSHTFKIQYKTDSAGTTYIKDARITAALATDLGDQQYAEDPSESRNSSTTYVDKLTLSFTPSTRNDYMVIAAGLGRQENLGHAFYANLDIDGTSYSEFIFAATDRDIYRAFHFVTKVNLTAASHTFKLQFRTGTEGSSTEAFCKDARILIIKANTLESYDSPSHTAIDNTFGTGEGTAYMWAHGLDASINYDIAYYDATVSGGGQKITSDTNMSTTSYGNLSFTCNLAYNSSAIPGTWHAVVFRAGSSPPTNYNDAATTTGYVLADSFTVQSEAIPEFPTVASAIAVTAICFGLYYWMRKRKLVHDRG